MWITHGKVYSYFIVPDSCTVFSLCLSRSHLSFPRIFDFPPPFQVRWEQSSKRCFGFWITPSKCRLCKENLLSVFLWHITEKFSIQNMSCDMLITALCLEVLHSNYFNSVKIETYLLVPYFCISREACCFLLYILTQCFQVPAFSCLIQLPFVVVVKYSAVVLWTGIMLVCCACTCHTCSECTHMPAHTSSYLSIELDTVLGGIKWQFHTNIKDSWSLFW